MASLKSHQKKHPQCNANSKAQSHSVAQLPEADHEDFDAQSHYVAQLPESDHEDFDAQSHNVAQLPEAYDEDFDEKSSAKNAATLYCLCQQPEDERTMLECDGCGEWYHLPCVLHEWGVLIFEYEVPHLSSFFCEKDECRQIYKLNLQELEDWGGQVVAHRVDQTDEELVLFKIEWNDNSPAVWVSEREIPNECLKAYRDKIVSSKTRKRQLAPVEKQPEAAVAAIKKSRRAPLPARQDRSRSRTERLPSPASTRCSARSRTPTRRDEDFEYT
jgi:hypothetical protein